MSFQTGKVFSNIIKDYLAGFFYQFAKTVTANKMREHGKSIAFFYDLSAVIVSWFLINLVLLNCVLNVAIFSTHPVPNQLSLASSIVYPVIKNLIWILPIQLLLFKVFGLYRGFWRFASIQDLKKIIYVSLLGGLYVMLGLNILHRNLSFEINILNSATHAITSRTLVLPSFITTTLYSIFLGVSLSSARLFIRFAKDFKRLHTDCQRVIIIGAGNAGESLVRDLLRDGTNRYKPVAFLDDDLRKLNREIHNVRVVGTIAELPQLIHKYEIDLVLIAIPSASSARMRSVVEVCEKANIKCYTLPGIKDLANGLVSINFLRQISLEDLLGRYPVECEWDSISKQLYGKTILVTGGGGSIGSELCRQIVKMDCATRLIILDSNEYNLYVIEMELRNQFPKQSIQPVLLNVTDRVGIQQVFALYQPQFVFHAAAYKHVPMLENQLRIAVHNNIIGTAVVAEEALKAQVETFVLISTDKAVNPTNIMGATKRAAEYFCQGLNSTEVKTQFITVRFGNVLNSAGSVIPLFRKQIEAGGPVTVTHPDIVRYFMTIPEASQLILQAAFLGEGGEIFVLDMGDPIKINYLAEQMIKLSGKIVNQDIKIVYTGLRPGEKLYEECFYADEKLQSTSHPKILKAASQKKNFNQIKNIVEELKLYTISLSTSNYQYMELIKQLVPEYRFDDSYLEKLGIETVVS